MIRSCLYSKEPDISDPRSKMRPRGMTALYIREEEDETEAMSLSIEGARCRTTRAEILVKSM